MAAQEPAVGADPAPAADLCDQDREPLTAAGEQHRPPRRARRGQQRGRNRGTGHRLGRRPPAAPAPGRGAGRGRRRDEERGEDPGPDPGQPAPPPPPLAVATGVTPAGARRRSRTIDHAAPRPVDAGVAEQHVLVEAGTGFRHPEDEPVARESIALVDARRGRHARPRYMDEGRCGGRTRGPRLAALAGAAHVGLERVASPASPRSGTRPAAPPRLAEHARAVRVAGRVSVARLTHTGREAEAAGDPQLDPVPGIPGRAAGALAPDVRLCMRGVARRSGRKSGGDVAVVFIPLLRTGPVVSYRSFSAYRRTRISSAASRVVGQHRPASAGKGGGEVVPGSNLAEIPETATIRLQIYRGLRKSHSFAASPGEQQPTRHRASRRRRRSSRGPRRRTRPRPEGPSRTSSLRSPAFELRDILTQVAAVLSQAGDDLPSPWRLSPARARTAGA